MSATVAVPEVSVSATDLTATIDAELTAFLATKSELLAGIDPGLIPLAEAARDSVLAGGKRLRPQFTYWGWRTRQPAGADGEPSVIAAASALELLHACALVHDDLMDDSDTRRGRPAAHVQFAARHRQSGWPGRSERFGLAATVLLGDLLLSWAEERFSSAVDELPTDRAQAARQQFDAVRTEVVAGQYLDVLAQTRGDFDSDEALRVIEYKTSKYTVVRPLLLGAAAAGAEPSVLTALADYGRAAGEAFQLRDDLLGVFGDPEQTGKPAGDDLREGKRTLLVALARQAADPDQAERLLAGLGQADLDGAGVRDVQSVLIETGAVAAVETRIAAQVDAAENAVRTADIAPDSAHALIDLAQAAAHRTS